MGPEIFIVMMPGGVPKVCKAQRDLPAYKKFYNYWDAWKLCCQITNGKVTPRARYSEEYKRRWFSVSSLINEP